jgi:hypothetical protein
LAPLCCTEPAVVSVELDQLQIAKIPGTAFADIAL